MERPVFRNRLLAALLPQDFDLLVPHLRPVELRQGNEVVGANRAVAECCFVEAGMISILVPLPQDKSVEVGMIGREGMAGIAAALGPARSPQESVVQIPGQGLMIDAAALRAAVERSPALMAMLFRYTFGMMVEAAQTAACNARHPIGQRLARWLLIAQDRAELEDLPLTHEFLSQMLGVRRAGVTVALHILEGEHVISARRGHVTIRNRARLEAAACACYAAARSALNGSA